MRSFMSLVVELFFRTTRYKEKLNNKIKCAEYLEKCRIVNQSPYNLSPKWKIESSVEKEKIHGVDVFVLNRKNRNQKTILYLHGGGYVEQPVKQHWMFLDKIAQETNAVIITPIYPKAPDNQYDVTFKMLRSLYKLILKDIDPENVFIMGDSAGGGMSLAFSQLIQDENLPQPAELLLISPWVDLSMDNQKMKTIDKNDPTLSIHGLSEMGKAWAGNTDLKHFLLSPLYGKFDGLPRMTVFAGGHEIFKFDILEMVEKARKTGLEVDYFEYPKMGHVYPLYPIPEADKARSQIVKRILNSSIYQKRFDIS